MSAPGGGEIQWEGQFDDCDDQDRGCDEDCDYDYGKLSKFKSCQCSNLELVNKEGGMFLYIIQVFL